MPVRLSQRKGESRKPPPSGRRKGKKSSADENIPIVSRQPPRPRPRRKGPNAPIDVDKDDSDAALALISMRQPLRSNPTPARNPTPMDHVFANALKIPLEEVLELEDEDNEPSDDSDEAEADGVNEDDVEELKDDADGSDTESTFEEEKNLLPCFDIPFEVPYKKATLSGMQSERY